MKKITMAKSTEVEGKPFILDDFIQRKDVLENRSKVTKSALKQLANELGLGYDEKQIGFTKKIMTAYLER